MQQAHTYYAIGDFSSAGSALRQALVLDPGNPAVRLQQALLLDAGGQFVEARAVYASLLASDPGTQVLVPSAINHVALSQATQAEATFKRILRKSAAAEERDYARVWIDLLSLRGSHGAGTLPYGKKAMETQRYGAVMDALSGVREVDDVAASVKSMTFSNEREKRMVATEYYFFLASIEQARSAMGSAEKLYRMALAGADGSIERPLILQSLGELRGPSMRAD